MHPILQWNERPVLEWDDAHFEIGDERHILEAFSARHLRDFRERA
jgi:hypothetical protein